ncbi:bifunctional nuclease family protein [Micrococcus luteus]|uniref:bifunctional nuclease family protein n=1 Tax=Micrococcus luteus TaxID=1270 RepID=UPI0020124AC9|nr:bifunctional nuclease family protein [Micrococcus luteus]
MGGAPEAAAAALALEGVRAPRPLTHELLLAAVDALGAEVVRVRLTEVRDEVVHAELVLSTGARVDARASDAVVVALRADAPVLGTPAVLADAACRRGRGRRTPARSAPSRTSATSWTRCAPRTSPERSRCDTARSRRRLR